MNTATTANTFRDAKRTQTSILAGTEKRILVWLAERMPAWINSDHLTALGFVAMILAGLSYWYASINSAGLLLACAFLAINWFGDSLDGTLARVRNRLRPRYGFYIDHVVDSFGSVFLFGGLALSGHMHQYIALGLMTAYLLLSIEIYLATYALGNFKISFGMMGPTELRILLSVGNVYLWLHPVSHGLNPFDVGGIAGIVGMILITLNSVRKHATTLYLEEKA